MVKAGASRVKLWWRKVGGVWHCFSRVDATCRCGSRRTGYHSLCGGAGIDERHLLEAKNKQRPSPGLCCQRCLKLAEEKVK